MSERDNAESLSEQELLLRVIFGGSSSEELLLNTPASNIALQEFNEDLEAATRVLSDKIDEKLSLLSPRERLVLGLRYGLEDGVERTLKEVGQEIGKSATTARRVEVSALSKLRRVARPETSS